MRITPELPLLLRTKKFRDKDILTLKDLYKLFPDKDSIPEEKFLFIATSFNEIFLEYIMYTGHVIKLPRRLGTLSIRISDPSTKGIVDYGHFRLTGEIVKYVNSVTEGRIVSFKWDNDSPYCLIPAAKFYKFKPLKSAKKFLHDLVNQHFTHNKYYPKY
jgi:hypothetical protein